MKMETERVRKKGLRIAVLCLAGLVIVALALFFVIRRAHPNAGARLMSYMEQEDALASERTGSALEEAIYAHATVHVDDSTRTEVQLTVTAPDMALLLEDIRQNGGTSQTILDRLENGDYPERVTALRTEIDDDGRPLEAWDFLDALYGGLLSYMEELAEEQEAQG